MCKGNLKSTTKKQRKRFLSRKIGTQHRDSVILIFVYFICCKILNLLKLLNIFRDKTEKKNTFIQTKSNFISQSFMNKINII